jgi:Tfp pilus assembly protein PilF/O-antigen ligase
VDLDGTDKSSETGRLWRGRRFAIYSASLVVLAAPLLIGSGPAWAQVTSVALMFAATLLFLVGRGFSVRAIPFALPAALGVAMTALQLVPLPAALVRAISPHAAELRAEAAGAPPAFLPLTLDVPATVIELGKGMACLALLLLVGNSARRSSRARPLVLTLAFVGAVVSIIHVVQRLTGASHILGVYEIRDLPGSGFFGTFVNGNQASSLLSLSALIAAGLARQSDGPLRVAAVGSALLSIGVVLSTGSRAGLLSLGLGGCVLAGLTLSRWFGPARGILLALGLLVGIGGFTLWTAQGLRARIASTAADRMSDQKIRGWRDTLRLVQAYSLTGVGRGAFEAPASGFRSDEEGVRLAFPENIGLQMFSEWGVPMSLALLLAVALSGRGVAGVVARLDPATQGAACAVLAVVLHEAADFGLELPGVAFPTVAALGLVVARAEQYGEHRSDYGRRLGAYLTAPAMVLWGLALAGSLWALPRTLVADGIRARALVAKNDPAALDQLGAAIRRHPADYYLELLAGGVAVATNHESAGRHLNRAQRLNPSASEAHLVTARWLTRNHRRSQAALEFRLAYQHGTSIYLDELWLAVGPRQLGNAVPQTDSSLLEAAGYLLRKGYLTEAREVSARAVANGGNREAVLLSRLRLALESQSKDFIAEAAREMLSAAREPASFAAAAQGLARIGQAAAADAAIDRGLTANPHDPSLVLAGARQRMARDDLNGAVAFLHHSDEGNLTLADRIQFDELGANLADRRGDVVTAAALRAHARSLTRLSSGSAEQR